MKRFAKLFVVMLGLATLGLVMSIVPRNDANAQSPTPVSVVNTPYVIVRNTPLPVTVRGIALGAPLPVSGNVGANIIGTPNLRVSNPVTLTAIQCRCSRATRIIRLASQFKAVAKSLLRQHPPALALLISIPHQGDPLPMSPPGSDL
jgi:hypothetical protein